MGRLVPLSPRATERDIRLRRRYYELQALGLLVYFAAAVALVAMLWLI